ncbi:DUF2169 family type VI secretion system accessory protein [Rhizobacter sp. P5_C2]
MRFTNDSHLPAKWTSGYDRDARELLIVVVKATYELPAPGDEPRLARQQVPLVEADEFTGEPGLSAPRYETDFAHRKPACDVLLNGQAHAPPGRRVSQLAVGLQVGSLVKQFNVVGDRRWHKRILGVVTATSPEPFETMPVGYDHAWGGTDRTEEASGGEVASVLANPVGRGFMKHTREIDGLPLPNTEEIGRSVTDHHGDYLPMAFSPVGRNWFPRHRWAGTYDDAWIEEQAPFWPDDFDDRYFHAAPADQVIPHPVGGEQVVLRNLTPDGLRAFRLPVHPMPVLFAPYRGRDLRRDAQIDTIVIEPELNRFCLTWRVTLPLGKSVFDVKEVIVGEKSDDWHRARRFPGKTYHRSLADAVAARRSARRERP